MIRSPSRPLRRSSPQKAAEAIAAIRPRGFVKLVAIHPDGAVPLSAKCFRMPEEQDAVGDWIAPRDGKMNLYLEPNPPRARADRRSKESDIAAVEYAYVDCDPKPGEDIEEAHTDSRAAGFR